jgi:activator of HSP90 ATPase
MVDAQKSGVGSIWNKGGWHWENRNYDSFAKEWLKKEWCLISETTEDAKIDLYEVKSMEGSASVTIRK